MEGVQNSGKTDTGVRGRDMGIEEGTGREVGGRRNANAMMGVCGVTKFDRIRNKIIRILDGQRNWEQSQIKYRRGG